MGLSLRRLDAYKIRLNLSTIPFIRPDIQRQGGDFIDIWNRFRILTQVYGMDVGPA